MPHRGYFVIADITGYTMFLTGSELDHAQDILKTLFNTLLDNIKPPLIISNFQGDAILTYAPDGSFLQGQTLVESIENIYCEFARTLENMHRNTTCTCQACRNIPRLDLKMFVHYGEYVVQDMRGKQELSGPDVIIAHRMMKNNVKEATGLRAYTLFSEASVKALGLEDFTCEMKPHSESYDHIGEVKMYAYCLATMWEREREKRRDFVKPEESWFVIDVDLPAPPAVVWDYLNEPEHRRRWMEVAGISLSGTKNGRVGVGSIHHCAHGTPDTADFIIMDWRPFEYVTQTISGLPLKIVGRFTSRLTPIEDGTHLSWIFASMSGQTPVSRMMAQLMRPIFKRDLSKMFTKCGQNMRQMIVEDKASGKLVVPLEPQPAG